MNQPMIGEKMNKYHGITHGLKKINNKTFVKKMKAEKCSKGIHAFDEVWSIDAHYLFCDICELEVHIKEIIENEDSNG